jgi:hypothetical protein
MMALSFGIFIDEDSTVVQTIILAFRMARSVSTFEVSAVTAEISSSGPRPEALLCSFSLAVTVITSRLVRHNTITLAATHALQSVVVSLTGNGFIQDFKIPCSLVMKESLQSKASTLTKILEGISTKERIIACGREPKCQNRRYGAMATSGKVAVVNTHGIVGPIDVGKWPQALKHILQEYEDKHIWTSSTITRESKL